MNPAHSGKEHCAPVCTQYMLAHSMSLQQPDTLTASINMLKQHAGALTPVIPGASLLHALRASYLFNYCSNNSQPNIGA
eukprot:jgi/Chrzof1/3143/Cz12g13130.t1